MLKTTRVSFGVLQVTHEASEIRVLVRRGRGVSPLLARERSRGLLFHKGLQNKVAVIRAKAELRLLARLGRRHASIVISRDT